MIQPATIIQCLLISLSSAVLTDTLCAQRYQVRTYDEFDGLTNPSIADLAQDSSGRIWFATRQRLASYDGFEWTAHGDGIDLPHSDQARVLVDELDRVWTLPRSPQDRLCLLENGAWTELDALPIEAIPLGRWLGATTVRRAKGVSLVAAVAGAGVFATNGGAWESLKGFADLDTATITDIESGDGE
ncbi:MAG: hypothetical protein ACI835_004639 [Planctomycetota bacterium]|jgi:hypothetical protein